jgi:hypothetical protein
MIYLSAMTVVVSMIAFTSTMYETHAFSLLTAVSTTPASRTADGITSSLSSATVLYATLAEKITTGPDGKAALNYDDDLRLTLQIIMDHQRRSATVSTEQLVQQVTAAASIVENDPTTAVDVSIPYDAAAKLAYDQESSSVRVSTPFEKYKDQYEAKAVADVIAKKEKSSKTTTATTKVSTVTAVTASDEEYDISIPYDAAAKLAYHALSADERRTTDYSTFQQQYTEKAVADVIAKKGSKTTTTTTASPVTSDATTITTTTTTTTTSSDSANVTVPYDAAAQLAYMKLQSIKHSLTYEQFRSQYERNAVSNVIGKKLKREQQQA